MAQDQLKRKLAAVMAADLVGYSRLMSTDETATFARLKTVFAKVFRPAVKRHGGRIFKLMGDGALVEFASANAAFRCATNLQENLAAQQADAPPDDMIRMRIGISLAEVIVEGSDLYGHGVNIAARMEALAEPGTICLAGNLREHLDAALDAALTPLGPCRVKNIADPIEVYQHAPLTPRATPGQSLPQLDQRIAFCKTPDGVGLAYSTMGSGSPVVSVSNWLTHLELDMKIPMRRELARLLSPDHQLIRYDARGSGLSDRDVSDFSLDATVLDLRTVLDALGQERVALIGQSQGAAIAAAFAARYPQRVSRLVLCGGYARGRRMRGSEGEIAESDAFITMIRQGWGKDIDAYVRMFGAFFMPDASGAQLSSFTELQRKATPPENAARIQLAIDSIDISAELSQIEAPTLVFHLREDARAPFEEGRRMAAGIPNARFIPLEGRNHVMLAGDPSLKLFLDEAAAFLSADSVD